MASIGWPEILIIVGILILLFGAAKLPELARSMGRSMRIFKSEVSEMKRDGKDDKTNKKTVKKEQIAAEAVVDPDAVISEEDTVTVEETDLTK